MSWQYSFIIINYRSSYSHSHRRWKSQYHRTCWAHSEYGSSIQYRCMLRIRNLWTIISANRGENGFCASPYLIRCVPLQRIKIPYKRCVRSLLVPMASAWVSLCVYVLFVIHAKCTNRLNTRMKYALYVQMCAALFCGCTNEWEIGSCLIVSDAVHVNVPKLNSTIFPCHFSLSKIAHIANTYCHIYIQKANRY